MIKEHVERYGTEGGRAINEGDWEAYGDFFSEDLVMRTPAIPGISRGREARVSLVQGMMAAVPDGHVEMVRSIVQGDRACLEWHWTGTNVDVPYCMVVRFEDGRIAEINEYYDQLGM